MKFRVIPPGKFRMRYMSLEGIPPNQVTQEIRELFRGADVTFTKPKLIGTTEVTQAEWESVMMSTPWKKNDEIRVLAAEGKNFPASYISQRNALAFLAKLNELEKTKKYRLPTEAEWEFACRAGGAHPAPEWKSIHEYGWFTDRFAQESPQPDDVKTEVAQPVGKKRPNAFGLYDMHGNLAEWTSDRFEKVIQGPLVDPGPRPGTDQEKYVYKGGNFLLPPMFAVSHIFAELDPTDAECITGFRVVCDIEEPK